jgi:hypothetical protein
MALQMDPDRVAERFSLPDPLPLDELVDGESLCWIVVENVEERLGQAEGQGAPPSDSVTVTPFWTTGLFASE